MAMDMSFFFNAPVSSSGSIARAPVPTGAVPNAAAAAEDEASKRAFAAASAGDVEALAAALDAGADVWRVHNGFMAHHTAAAKGRTEVFAALLARVSKGEEAKSKGEELLAAPTESGRSAMHLAANGGHVDTMRQVRQNEPGATS